LVGTGVRPGRVTDVDIRCQSDSIRELGSAGALPLGFSMSYISVQPALLRWARERSGVDEIALTRRIPQLKTWERGDKRPTFKQLEAFAKATNTPLGFLFLPAPPEEKLPIRDLRTVKDNPSRPSPELLDTIYAMQRRQDWLREERVDAEAGPLEFVGSARLNDDAQAVGQEMRRAVGVADEWAAQVANWQEAVSELRRRFEGLGVMTVINGVVGNNTHRKLDVEEFRGFVLCRTPRDGPPSREPRDLL
jgi:transcriptional regulator with XRE-family HTH domain